MESTTRWSMPSWDTLFAGRKTAVTQRHENADASETDIRGAANIASGSGASKIPTIANQGQGQMEEELQGAFSEGIPGAVQPPTQAHLADASPSSRPSLDHLGASSSQSSFPKVIRNAHDSVGLAQSTVSLSHVAAKSSPASPSLTSPHATVTPAMPQEAWQPSTSEPFLSHYHTRSVSAVQRAGRQSLEGGATDETEERSDVLSGQWASGAAPQAGQEGDLQADLWQTLTSLFGDSSSTASTAYEESRDGFLGAVAHLQSILGESTSEQSRWKKEEDGEIARALQQSSQPAAPLGDTPEQAREDKSGIRHQPTYLSPRLPIVFAHGLFGAPSFTPAALREAMPALSIVYWRGIADTLQRRGIEVLVAKVPMSGSIQERAESLRDVIEKEFPHREINLIGHSMGGLDGRYLVSQLDSTFTVRSLTTIATPHRGSTFADFMIDKVIGQDRLPALLKLVERSGLPGGGRAFACLTVPSMRQFNEVVQDRDSCVYMSWGAACQPGFFHEFRIPYGIIKEVEGDNDGLVSVESSKWAEYRGTLQASHLDLIGWTNRVAAAIGPGETPFDPKPLYLTICEDLAIRGL